ncbi:MAG: MlrC C-terminal domain-containing protein, partial [Alphaproteobacteria bacterium]
GGGEANRLRPETTDAAIDAALSALAGTTVIAETSDDAGGGAPSDCTAVLARLLARGVRDAAIGIFWDPIAVSFCREAGAGARLPLRLGGKCGAISGDPLDLEVFIHAVADDASQTSLSGGRVSLGPAAWIEVAGIHVILGSIRQQCFNPDAFTGLGCRLDDKRIVVVKSSQHFYAGFAPIARDVRYCAAETGILRDFASIPFQVFNRPYWPKVVRRQRLWDQIGDLSNGGFLAHRNPKESEDMPEILRPTHAGASREASPRHASPPWLGAGYAVDCGAFRQHGRAKPPRYLGGDERTR